MGFRLIRADYFDGPRDRPPLVGVEYFGAGYPWEETRPTMGALRRELSAQGALEGGEELLRCQPPVNFAEDAERIHAQCVQTADSWRIFPKAVTGSLAVLSDEPVIREPVTLDFGGGIKPLTIARAASACRSEISARRSDSAWAGWAVIRPYGCLLPA